MVSSSLGNVNLTVNSEGKLVFTDATGADSVLPFNRGGTIKVTTNGVNRKERIDVAYDCTLNISGTFASGNYNYVYLYHNSTKVKQTYGHYASEGINITRNMKAGDYILIDCNNGTGEFASFNVTVTIN